MMRDIFAQPGMGFVPPVKKILVVDEEAGDLRILRLTLEGQGYRVSTCATYESGVQTLEKEPFDFVVVSQGTHAFEGRKIVERAAELDRSQPVLVLTRCMDMSCYLEAMQLGAVDYLEKPVPPAELLRFVRAHTEYNRLRGREAAA